uniref:G protein-coupled receptor n=1 Tax=Globodera rostochiensis TaxID=31243 RepID=A0A914H852_GLORO
MEVYIFRHHEYERLYNCTGLDIDSVPLERRQYVPESIVLCVLCAIYYVLYVPCMYSIWKHLRENSCYKLLFYIGITDIVNMGILGFESGWLSLTGAVFCTHPTLIYISGVSVTTFWIAESTADLILALNRCLELGAPHYARIFFSGRRTTMWIIACSLYALYWTFFKKPVLFSGMFFAWFFNPYVGYRADDQNDFEVRLQILQDIGVALLCPTIYLIFAVKLLVDVRKSRQHFGAVMSELNTIQAKTFAQVFLVSMLNTVTGTIYVYMQYYSTEQWMITVGEFAWFHVHGFPPVIYLALNKTIRDDCRMLYMKVFKRHRVSYVSGITIIRPETTHTAYRATAPI